MGVQFSESHCRGDGRYLKEIRNSTRFFIVLEHVSDVGRVNKVMMAFCCSYVIFL